MEIQVNVVDRYILLKAQEEPGKCQDLVVRIAGDNDYFVTWCYPSELRINRFHRHTWHGNHSESECSRDFWLV